MSKLKNALHMFGTDLCWHLSGQGLPARAPVSGGGGHMDPNLETYFSEQILGWNLDQW